MTHQRFNSGQHFVVVVVTLCFEIYLAFFLKKKKKIMASALEKLMKGTIQKSDAQKAFSPWWETLEDKLLYSLMILGKPELISLQSCT